METKRISRRHHTVMKNWCTRPATFLALLFGLVAMVGWGSTSAARDGDGWGHHHPRILKMGGMAHGGYLAVTGSAVSLFEVGTSGYGSAPTLLAHTITNAQGNWNIASFNCSPANAELYLTSVGGNAGLGSNSAINLIAAIGRCNNLPDFVNIDEVTTVASLYALRPFITFTGTRANIGSSSTNATGLANAAALVSNLVNVTTGRALAITPGGNGTPPRASINTLANLLVTCISSSGSSSGGCASLFAAATPAGGTAPTDTASATVDIAGNPINHVAALYALAASVGSSPFTPVLSAAPTSWTLLVSYTGGGLNNPIGIAVDAAGDTWTANLHGNTLSKFNPLGSPFSPSGYSGGGLNGPAYVAIDASGNVWVTDQFSDSASEFSSNGSAISPAAGYANGELGFPQGVAIDENGNVWIANTGINGTPSVYEIEGGSTPPTSCPTTAATGDTGCLISSAAGYTGGGLNNSRFVAIDGGGNVWLSNDSGNSVSEFVGGNTPPVSCPVAPTSTDTGCPLSPAGGYTGGGIGAPFGITVDHFGNVWVANQNSSSLSELVGGSTPPSSCPASPTSTDTGCPLSPAGGYTGGGLNFPQGLIGDSAGNIWVTGGNGLEGFNSSGIALSPPNAVTGGFANGAFGEDDAVDPSGNIWFFNQGTNTLKELIGLASPVLTPAIGSPGVIADNMNNALGFFSTTVVQNSSGTNIDNPPGYLKPTATANGDGTVTLAVNDDHLDTTEEIVDYRLPSASNPYMDLSATRFLELNLTDVSASRQYNVNLLFWGAGTSPTFISEVPWLTNSTSLHPNVDVLSLAPTGAQQYFVRFRLFPTNQVGNVLTLDSIDAAPSAFVP